MATKTTEKKATKATKTTKPVKKAVKATTPKPAAPAKDKKNVYQIVTEQVIDVLKSGIVPWRKPWTTQRPHNGKSKRPYHGLNRILLGLTSYADPRWFTWNQVKELGGEIREGEAKNSHLVVFWNFKEVEDPATGKKETIPLLRYYRVYNAEQTEGLELPALEKDTFEPLDAAQAVVDGYFAAQTGLSLVHGGNEASYSPKADHITMPNRGAFMSVESYYATLNHELAHSTGHATRLKRFATDQAQAHGTQETYAKEELVAEMAAAFLNNEVGIASEIESTVEYLAGWIKALEGDARLLVSAAGKAKKAADLILGITQEATGEPEAQVAEVIAIAGAEAEAGAEAATVPAA